MAVDSQIWIAAGLSFVACFLLIPLFGRAACYLGLTDKPDGRKRHEGHIPIVGGVAIFLSVFGVVIFMQLTPLVLAPLIVGSVLVLIGTLDDRFNLSAHIRFPFQIAAALAMIYFGQLGIESVGNITGAGPVVITGVISVLFTIMCTVGVINSINMIDGVDGLSGVVISLTLLPIIYFCWKSGDTESVVLLVSCLGAISAFLCYNSRVFRARAYIFMGDAGSMLFGLLIVWYFIQLTQGDDPVLSPVAAGWIFGLPLVDTVSVLVGRLLHGRSPLEADRSHLHHRLLGSGLSVNQTVCVIASAHSIFIVVGIICNIFPKLEPLVFWLFVFIVVAHHFLTPRLLQFLTDARKRDGMVLRTIER